MRITRIYIEKYKGLEKLEVFFDHDFSVIIGENGSGKSRILEFISEVLIPHNNRLLLIKGDFEIEFDNGDVINNQNWSNKTTIFPKIIGYYSGGNKQLELIFYKNDSYLLDKYLNWNKTSTEEIGKNSFYFQSYFFSLALLHLLNEYRYGNQACSEFIRGVFGEKSIDDIFVKFQVTLQKQSWFDNKLKFWGARGLLGEVIKILVRNSQEMYDYLFDNNFLDRKYDLTESEKDEIELGVCKLIEKKGLVISFTNLEFLNFGEIEYPGFGFLEAFDLLSLSSTIKNTSLFIKNKKGITLPDEFLSEGERQLIAIYGISSYFNGGDNVLFIMDEPDVYMHPKWQHEFIPKLIAGQDPRNTNSIILINSGENQKSEKGNSQFIISTHSPLLAGSSDKVDIIGLSKGTITCATNPKKYNKHISDIDVYGNRAEFIYEELFGLSSTRAESVEKIAKEIDRLLENDIPNIELLEQKTNELLSHIKDDIGDEYQEYKYILQLKKIKGEN